MQEYPGLQTLNISKASNQEVDGCGMELAYMKELRILLSDDSINVTSVPANLLWLQIRDRFDIIKASRSGSEDGREYPVARSTLTEIFSIVPENNELVVLDIGDSYRNLEAVMEKVHKAHL